MQVDVAVNIDASRDAVWALVTDVERAPQHLSSVDTVEVLERPANGLNGLKWKETRTLYGKSATETMWITDVDDGSSYVTEARSHGSVYRTQVRVADGADGTRLSMSFSAEPESLGARIAAAVLGLLIKRSVRNQLQKDLNDLKNAAESGR